LVPTTLMQIHGPAGTFNIHKKIKMRKTKRVILAGSGGGGEEAAEQGDGAAPGEIHAPQ
jgi:hypothetical protein